MATGRNKGHEQRDSNHAMRLIPQVANISGLPARTTSLANPALPENNRSPSSQADSVDISSLGRALSALGQTSQPGGSQGESSPYELPEEIQRLLEYIRDLQRQLHEQQQQLARATADTSLSQETKQLELAGLQASISALTSSLMSAMTQLFQELSNT